MAWQIERTEQRLELAGELRLAEAPQIWERLCELVREPGRRLDFDLTATRAIDGAIMALLVELRGALSSHGTRTEIVGINDDVHDVVEAYGRPLSVVPEHPRTGRITQLGIVVEGLLRGGRTLVCFVGELAGTVARAVRHPLTLNLRSLPALLVRAGFDGIAIVVVLNFLVGVVMAFQSTQQLRLFGANIFVADIVGVSITRELAPLMTAVILAGRSGAAFAAELGTMRVSEEIDALRTMGFLPMSYLVLPRIVTLALIAPALTVLGDVAGVSGGVVIGARSLDVTPTQFLAELRGVLVGSDVWTGLVKSFAFGIAIAVIGCRHGLATRGAAEGVGRGTTATVVECLFAIVILDTLFTVLFRGAGV